MNWKVPNAGIATNWLSNARPVNGPEIAVPRTPCMFEPKSVKPSPFCRLETAIWPFVKPCIRIERRSSWMKFGGGVPALISLCGEFA
jgi:hypothetical protein